MPRKTNTTYKVGKSFVIDCILDLTKLFTDCYRKRSKWIAAIHRNNWTPVSERWICSYHSVPICWI